jgi:hypothetical protein
MTAIGPIEFPSVAVFRRMRRMLRPFRLLLVSSTLALGCATDPPPVEVDAAVEDTATLDDAPAVEVDTGTGCATTPTYTELRDTIFTANCATGRCHGGTTGLGRPEGPGDFTATSTRDVWVNRASIYMRGIVVVTPGDPDASFMLSKLTDDLPADQRLGGEAMPPNGRDPWVMRPQSEIDAIRCWIAGGAP